MDTTLITVTLLSMGMAGVLSIIVWRMLRDERQRSDARVQALAALSSHPVTPAPSPSPVLPVSPVKPPAADIDLPLRTGPPPVTAPLFAVHRRDSPWPRRAGIMACLALAVASAVLMSLTLRDRAAAASRHRPGDATAAPVAASPAHLDLMALRDSRTTDGLIITGLVQNPPGGARLDRVTVTAYAFDDTGGFVSSGHAPLDVRTLNPGDASPFVITVPAGSGVARYRITFRLDDGAVITHVDRRPQAATAANW